MSASQGWIRAGAFIACWLVATGPAFAESAKAKRAAAPAKRGAQASKPRKVAVAAFDAPEDSNARAEVLTTLADHDDVEVIALDDLTFAGQRLKADPKTPEGRKKLSEEFGVEVWIDGRVDGDTAQLTLSSVDGTKLEETSLQAPTPKLLDALAGERMWQSMGRHLSVRENRRRRLLDESERARAKLEARAAEAQREQALAKHAREEEHERAEQASVRAREEAQEADLAQKKQLDAQKKQLEAQHTLAQKKLDARQALMNRQLDIALTRKAEELVARENLEAARKAQQQQLAAQSAAAKERAAAHGNLSMHSGSKPIPGWSTNAGGAPTGPKGVSAATQRWLMQQQANVAPSSNAQASQTRAPYAAANGGDGISPATQRWLAQQQEVR
jgi:flagellar biosynthesis GTPase FlhF